MAVPKQTFLQRLTSKYRLVILNDDTLDEQLTMRLSRMNVYMVLSSAIVILTILISLLIIFTPLKQYIPGYAGAGDQLSIRKKTITITKRLDSLEKVNVQNDKYIKNLKKVINGDFELKDVASFVDSTKNYDSIDIESISPVDSANRAKYDKDDIYTIDKKEADPKNKKARNLFFFKPVEGVLTQNFDPKTNHFGIDIVAQENSAVKAVLDGVVVLDAWTMQTGYVLAIQHDNNLISFYKHNSVIMKKTGNFVGVGDVIAVVGNTGEQSTGPHLHLEIWDNGKPINPLEFLDY